MEPIKTYPPYLLEGEPLGTCRCGLPLRGTVTDWQNIERQTRELIADRDKLTAERDALDTQLKEAREQRDEARALLDGIVSQFASLKGGDATCATQRDTEKSDLSTLDSGNQNPRVASTGASEVPSSLSAEHVDNFKDCPRTTKAMRLGSACKPTHWYTTADFSDTLERELTTALAQIERLRGALENAKGLLIASAAPFDSACVVIAEALAQEPVEP